ncbi:electron carrier/ protein disulfide oxidoreductase [Wolffia australiana]
MENSADNSFKDALELHQTEGAAKKLENLDLCRDLPGSNDTEDKKDTRELENESPDKDDAKEAKKTEDDYVESKLVEPVFDGTERIELEATDSSLNHTFDYDTDAQGSAWPEKAVALKNFVKEKSAVAVSSFLRRLSGKKDDDDEGLPDVEDHDDGSEYPTGEARRKDVSPLIGEWSTWNPLNLIKIGPTADESDNVNFVQPAAPPAMKGRIIVYTRLGCEECKEVRRFIHGTRLRYVEINIDVYPSRKLELEKNTGSAAVPRVFFNDLLVGGLDDLITLYGSGKFADKINLLINDEPSPVAPLPPLPGEDDVSGSGTIDELASIVRKMKEFVIPRDRFYKMRMFTKCFLGSEAVDFLSEDQYLEREEAVEFGRKLVGKHFFRHVLDENTFEDGNHLYRFLDDDPIVASQCYNIPRGITEVKPKPLTEISSRLRLLSHAISEAYASDDGKHVDYGGIYISEECKRYLRIIEELQRVELRDVSREEKLAFFINLYNMMAIHAILTWGYPVGPIDRRKFLGDFKYVIGGFPYSLSGIQNGILRGNQRPPYNITKPFGPRDGRAKVSLPYAEPLVHFALVCGTRSGPALRWYSPGNIDKELMEAARSFLRSGALLVDPETNIVSATKILKWFSVDFGKNETEVIKHAANYLESSESAELLRMVSSGHLRVVYQPFDWGLNY